MLNTTKALSVPLNSIRSKPDSSVKCLECVSKRKIRKFEWILRQFKEETRRLSSAKSRVDDAEMAQKTPKLRIREFLRHTLSCAAVIFLIITFYMKPSAYIAILTSSAPILPARPYKAAAPRGLPRSRPPAGTAPQSRVSGGWSPDPSRLACVRTRSS